MMSADSKSKILSSDTPGTRPEHARVACEMQGDPYTQVMRSARSSRTAVLCWSEIRSDLNCASTRELSACVLGECTRRSMHNLCASGRCIRGHWRNNDVNVHGKNNRLQLRVSDPSRSLRANVIASFGHHPYLMQLATSECESSKLATGRSRDRA